MTEDELRAAFEAHCSKASTWGLKRSRKGTYVNPATARDWKWFKLGAEALGAHTAANAYAHAMQTEALSHDMDRH
jgi:hypothetical protein